MKVYLVWDDPDPWEPASGPEFHGIFNNRSNAEQIAADKYEVAELELDETLRQRIENKIAEIEERCRQSFKDVCDEEQIEILRELLE